MTRSPISSRQRNALRVLKIMNSLVSVFNLVFITWFRLSLLRTSIARPLIKSNEQQRLKRIIWLNRLTKESDIVYVSQLRMDRSTFVTLCEMVRDIGGLRGTQNMTLEEIVALFLYVLAHHKKNRMISLLFLRSGETISRQFNRCLLAILKLHEELLQKPQPIAGDCESNRWDLLRDVVSRDDGLKIPQGTQVRIILACCLPHNLIRKYMSVDPLELEQAEEDKPENEEPLGDDDYLTHINPTNEWSNFRNDLAWQLSLMGIPTSTHLSFGVVFLLGVTRYGVEGCFVFF
ncbi:hypothetical protein CTI12_AA576600 [Artemisia annua]|uniref:DUF8040 domain-containing protein n=1 Tax=Artemisia annua TaxID=35608 RepID=A0A2U1KQC2_ARTAN|nr:hypothetical protein CTI12_AA576600 [Artemisia annua]